MKLFIDTASLKEIEEAAAMGLLDGVTTNPTLLAKEGKPFKETILKICKAVSGPVSVEAVATDAAGMLKEGREYAKWAKNVVVKIPMTAEGMKAVKVLSAEGIKTNVTLVFSPNQALLAAKAGATYVSPFVGRLDDAGNDGMEVVKQIIAIYKNYGFKTQVLVASVRHPMHLVFSALMGADVATVPFHVLSQLFKHPLTDVGLERFLADWKKVPSK